MYESNPRLLVKSNTNYDKVFHFSPTYKCVIIKKILISATLSIFYTRREIKVQMEVSQKVLACWCNEAAVDCSQENKLLLLHIQV